MPGVVEDNTRPCTLSALPDVAADIAAHLTAAAAAAAR